MLKQILLIGGMGLVLAGCASTDWVVIQDVKQIAAMREEVNKPHLTFKEVTLVRMTNEKGQRAEAISIGPTVIGVEKNGPPAARTLFTFNPQLDRLVLFTQDVKNWKAFRKEIPIAELKPGKAFRFPVVQETGEVVEQTFTVERIIIQ